ncbi:hypothetical protein HYG81_21320 (plasmid) [Natrinema zhouii]|uniref:hypothetical protein n=1 Tax=Natrinema zhouii TaxID=1710539 RepID=UPI001CFF9411|nr:hypothetical protein [Natrinema zhouii]UHQ98122.1 hypothetical protein HYG81_21320 [Natrinema zhouii]
MSNNRKTHRENNGQQDLNQDNEKQQVNFRVNDAKKIGWESFVEKSDYATLSHFLRTAAEKEIAQAEANDGEPQSPYQQDDSSEEILEKLSGITTKLSSMDRRLSAIEANRYGDDDLDELVTRVYQQLPTSIHDIHKAEAKKLEGKPGNTGSVEDLAQHLDADESAVEMAVQRLRNTTHSICQTESEDEIVHYYKRE